MPLALTRYDDAQRIAGLLVPPVDTPAPEEAMAAEPAAPQEPANAAFGTPGAKTAPDAGAAPQVLRPTDLSAAGDAGQVTRPGASRTQPVPGQAVGQPNGRSALRNWARPEPMSPITLNSPRAIS